MKLTYSEENYLKTIYILSKECNKLVPTNAIANSMQTSAASVTDMIQKLYDKELITYQKYQGVQLLDIGKKWALRIMRKHLLWEVFLFDKLKFGWDEIHEVAEQLEHIQSDMLIDRLETFLQNPYCSPHGIVIPDADGRIQEKPKVLLTKVQEGGGGIVSAIKDGTPAFFNYLYKKNIHLGAKVVVMEKMSFDDSIDIKINNQYNINISYKVANQIWISG